jgi:succinyl-CoA synthetase beta subunit
VLRSGSAAGQAPAQLPAGPAAGLADVAGSWADAGYGLATVHDSGLERALVADLAQQLGVPFAVIGEATRARLAAVLDPGLEPGNPLDIWGTGREPERQLTEALAALADDPAVGAVAFAVDLVPEEDESYPRAMLAAAARTGKPLAVLAGLPSTIDRGTAARLRAAGIPVLEGTRSGLLALRHLLAHAAGPAGQHSASPGCGPAASRAPGGDAVVVAATAEGCGGCDIDRKPVPSAPAEAASRAPGGDAVVVAATAEECGGCDIDRKPAAVARDARERGSAAKGGPGGRAERWRAALAAGPLDGAASFDLLRDYGIPAVRVRAAASLDAALVAAAGLGYPVVLKTDQPGIAHKSDAGGVRLGLAGPGALAAAYRDLADRLGPRVLVCQTAAPGTEMLLGIATDPALGPLVVAGAGGVLAELLADRVVALPPAGPGAALAMLRRLRVFALLAGARGAPAADLGSVVAAITGLSAIAAELGGDLAALDINPLVCGPGGAVAVDALVIPAGRPTHPGLRLRKNWQVNAAF